MNNSKVGVAGKVVVGLVLVASAAHADVAMDPDPDPSLSATAAPPDAPRWPRSVIDRPLTLPAALVLAGPDMIGSRAADGSSQIMGDVNLGVGITDDVELNTLTPTGTFKVSSPGLAGPWDGGVGIKVLRGALGGRLEVIARVVAGYDFEAHAARTVRIGAQAQFNVTSSVAIVVHDTGVMPGISFDAFGTHAASFGLPIGIGAQVHSLVWVEADTNVVSSLSLHATPDATVANVAPLYATAIVNLDHGAIDVLGYAGASDCYHASSTMFFGLGARYYAGQR